MLGYITRRVLYGALILLGVNLATFFLFFIIVALLILLFNTFSCSSLCIDVDTLLIVTTMKDDDRFAVRWNSLLVAIIICG